MKKRSMLLFLLLFLVGCNNTPDPVKKKEAKTDTTAPTIEALFTKSLTIESGNVINLLDGVYGLDLNEDNEVVDLTDDVKIDDDGFDYNKVGVYNIIYTLKDKYGNEATPIMRTITVIDIKNASLVAHRGGKGYGLENTKEAFEKAIENGYYGVECDVQETADGEIVVYHDLNIERLTGINIDVKSCTWKYLQTLTFSKVETDGNTYTGKMLLFSDFLEIVKGSNTRAFIELKETCTQVVLDKIMEIIADSGIKEEKYVIIANSSSIELLVSLRKQYPTLQLEFVGRTNWQNYMQTCLDNNIDLDVSYTIFDESYDEAVDYVDKFKEKGLKVNIWVVNKYNDLKKYLTIGADYITTDSLLPQDLKK